MTARELVVDLAVHYEELAAQPMPHWLPGITLEQIAKMGADELRIAAGTTSQRFQRWYTFGNRLFHMAIAAGVAVEHAAQRPTEALAALRQTIDDGAYLLYELAGALDDGLGYIGHEYGYFYGGQPWDELCVFRSGVRFLYELCELPPDDDVVEAVMARYGIEMFEEPLEVPAGMPRRHWWWFGDSPSA